MKTIFRILACGSVDDGKSTVLGRLLADLNYVYKDQIAAARDINNKIDYAFLLDGLQDERKRKVTIDIAYRFFQTSDRYVIVADAPGHSEYTKNMAVAASFSDAAIVVIDATKGLTTQSIRHILICKMMGIESFIFVINKMDLVGYKEEVFTAIKESLLSFDRLVNSNVFFIPTSALYGENIITKSEKMDWYKDKALACVINKLHIPQKTKHKTFEFYIQRVVFIEAHKRLLQGILTGGSISEKSSVIMYPNRQRVKIKQIYKGLSVSENAEAGENISILIEQDLDISRGDLLCEHEDYTVCKKIICEVLWCSSKQLKKGGQILIQGCSKVINAKVDAIYNILMLNNDKRIQSNFIEENQIAQIEFSLSDYMIAKPFEQDKTAGRFILIDAVSYMTVGCGIIKQCNAIVGKNKYGRESTEYYLIKKPITIWFTGLSGSGKTTLANMIEKHFIENGEKTIHIDGDEIRKTLCRDLGYSEADRRENVRRVAEICRILNKAGILVITSLISPSEKDRNMAKKIIGNERFYEIYLSASYSVCKERDVKGLYEKAQIGKIDNFTGLSQPYDIPQNAFLSVDTANISEEAAFNLIMTSLHGKF